MSTRSSPEYAGGYAVLGFDIDPEKRAALEKIGGIFASSLSDVAQQCAPILIAVFNTEQVELAAVCQ
jgi:3-hydroxyisobutyrate dehydrogenase-like beta-hydroxyacid dehydrogenase